MISAKNLLARNLKDGKYRIVKENRWFSKVICYLDVDKGMFLFTNKSGSHQMLPPMEFKNAIHITIKNGFYDFISKSALSMWPVLDEKEQHRIINFIEDLVLNHVIFIDDGK